MGLLSIFKKENSRAALRERQNQVEKLLAESLRMLGQVCGKLADVVDSQRLQRNGYEKQERYLERLDEKK